MKGILEIIGTNGHTLVEWDTDVDTNEAAEQFEKHVKEQGYVAFGEDPDGGYTLVEKFDETLPRIILSPQYVGG